MFLLLRADFNRMAHFRRVDRVSNSGPVRQAGRIGLEPAPKTVGHPTQPEAQSHRCGGDRVIGPASLRRAHCQQPLRHSFVEHRIVECTQCLALFAPDTHALGRFSVPRQVGFDAQAARLVQLPVGVSV